jgi:signal transduction histidine kinase
VLLSDDARESLWGCMGIGPSSPEEAGRIWSSLSQNPMTFDETLRLYKSCGIGDAHVNNLILSIRIPLSENADFIARAVREKKSVIIGPEMIQSQEDRTLRDKFDVDFLAVVPLMARDSLQGVILADNIITGRPILQTDLNVLEIFAKYASDAIENSRLYGTLENQISLLKEANEKIIRSRENLVRAEKLSCVGKMALEVAHEIRNPLTIIGGHTNLRLRKVMDGDSSRETLELISSQVRRIENTLDKFSSVVRLSEKKEDRFPLIELIQEALGMLSSESNFSLPKLIVDDSAVSSSIFTDKGLFHQALMSILKEASRITRGMQNVVMTVRKRGDSAVIFICGGENNSNFAENFYSGLRKRDEEGRYQEMAVALEIIQHYGGDIGIGSLDGLHGRIYIEIPLCEEVP